MNAVNTSNYSPKTASGKSVGGSVRAKMSLSQLVAVLIERWDELAEAVKEDIAELFRDG
tara:strand:- start:446 stop:622 length:177 start_codon:yes stop_codon:yes gene_type:complete